TRLSPFSEKKRLPRNFGIEPVLRAVSSLRSRRLITASAWSGSPTPNLGGHPRNAIESAYCAKHQQRRENDDQHAVARRARSVRTIRRHRRFDHGKGKVRLYLS